MATVDGPVTLTLLRPVQAFRWTSRGKTPAKTVLPAGHAVTLSELVPGSIVLSKRPYAEVDHEDLIRAAAAEPCEHFRVEHDERLGWPDYFDCFDMWSASAEQVATCRGDRTKCPFAEAASLEQNNKAPIEAVVEGD